VGFGIAGRRDVFFIIAFRNISAQNQGAAIKKE